MKAVKDTVEVLWAGFVLSGDTLDFEHAFLVIQDQLLDLGVCLERQEEVPEGLGLVALGALDEGKDLVKSLEVLGESGSREDGILGGDSAVVLPSEILVVDPGFQVWADSLVPQVLLDEGVLAPCPLEEEE